MALARPQAWPLWLPGWAVWVLAVPLAHAQGAPLAPAGVSLRLSETLVEQLAPEARGRAPSFVSGQRISGQAGERTVVEGEAELRRHDTVIRADRLELDHTRNHARASGHVRVLRNGNRYEGPELELNLDTYTGFFARPRYQLLATEGAGSAARVDFLGERRLLAHEATYSTCPVAEAQSAPSPAAPAQPEAKASAAPGCGPAAAEPAWWVQAQRLEIDTETDTGRAWGGALYFKGVPILAAPTISFPLSDRRKSGLLPPTINLTNRSGLEFTQPYYWNIAPNLDATFYPTLMTKRGLDWGTEVRYLQPTWKGETQVSLLPADRVYGQSRWSARWRHEQGLGDLWPGLQAVGWHAQLNRVSDDDYWKDLPRLMPLRGEGQSPRLLPNEAVLSGRAGAVGLTAGVYTWQTLQDAAAPITAPYDRVPHVQARWEAAGARWGWADGLDASLLGELTRFRTARSPTVSAALADLNGTRLLGIAQLSRSWQSPGWFFRPKLQAHWRHYQTDLPLASGWRANRLFVPTLSLDGGLVLEREAALLGRLLLQTLEPRAFYVRTPYREQGFLPNYDSAAKDFNVGTAWTENAFGGNDRISDTHALTLGVTSRLIAPDTGAEAARLTVAQRMRFDEQRVVLPGGAAVTDRFSDVLLGGSLSWDPRWTLEGSVQFNPEQGRSQRTTLTGRYHPRPFRSLSAAYRLQRAGGPLAPSEQLDVGWQWPLAAASAREGGCGGSWYSVGRMNYSIPERKLVDVLTGFEYDAGCWIGRVVLEKLQVGTTSANQRVLLQLEFRGLARVGSNPLQTLRNHIPRYTPLNDRVQTPSRFGSYE